MTRVLFVVAFEEPFEEGGWPRDLDGTRESSRSLLPTWRACLFVFHSLFWMPDTCIVAMSCRSLVFPGPSSERGREDKDQLEDMEFDVR